MSEMATVIIVATLLAGPNPSVVSVQQPPGLRIAQGQVPLGRLCWTPRGACPIPPQPLKTQCFCGGVAGEVRP
jgi:hypothetical protein